MFSIRAMRESDVPVCYEITLNNWNVVIADNFLIEVSHAWSGMEYAPSYYIAEADDGTVIGYAGVMHSFIKTGVWDVVWINVKRGHKGEGVGMKLMGLLISEVKKANGVVIHLMTKSPSYFSQFGFSKITQYDSWTMMSLPVGQFKEGVL
jgi:N-acetylglutamate synthase-like GNAT family acetyltransferase